MGINQPDIQPLGLKQANTGATPNDGQGDDLREAFEKHNYNMQVIASHLNPKLTADTIYYVSPTGLDTNTGTTISSPYATIAKALSSAYQLNTNGKVIKIRLLDGTYTESVYLNNSLAGAISDRIHIYIEGNTANPDAVTLNLNTTLGYCIKVQHNINVHLAGLRFVLTNLTLEAQQYFVGVYDGAFVALNKCVFTALSSTATDAAHIVVSRAKLEFWGEYAIAGGARQHIKAVDGIVEVQNTTLTPYAVTVSNNPVFSQFVSSNGSSTIVLASLQIAYSGSASGLEFTRDFDARFLFSNNLPSGLTPGTQNAASLAAVFCTAPAANDDSARVPDTAWVRDYVDDRIAALETILNSLGSGLNDAINGMATVPKGAMLFWPSAAIPNGYLLCNGQAVSRDTYANLFAVIGTSYGAGNGSSTFNVPPASGRFVLCAGQGAGLTNRVLGVAGGTETHALTINELPAHSHVVVDPGHVHALSDPGHTHALYDPGHAHALAGWTYDTDAGEGSDGDGSAYRPVGAATFAAGTNMAVYGAGTGITLATAGTSISVNNTGSNVAHNNMPPFLALNLIIKT